METWEKTQEARREAIAKKEKREKEKGMKQFVKAKQQARQEEMKGIKTNAEIAGSAEFQAWCHEQGIEPTKRTAAKHRDEFEAYLANKEKELVEAA